MYLAGRRACQQGRATSHISFCTKLSSACRLEVRSGLFYRAACLRALWADPKYEAVRHLPIASMHTWKSGTSTNEIYSQGLGVTPWSHTSQLTRNRTSLFRGFGSITCTDPSEDLTRGLATQLTPTRHGYRA